MEMNNIIVLLIILLETIIPLLQAYSPYDFGIFESQPLLENLVDEDTKFTLELKDQFKETNVSEIVKFLEEESISIKDRKTEKYLEGPLNAYHLIRKYSVVLPKVLSKVKPYLRDHILNTLVDKTKVIKSLDKEDLRKCLKAFVIMIHSYDLDMNFTSTGRFRNQDGVFSTNQDVINTIHEMHCEDIGEV